jgi:anti-sigma regulatory factor (Ser/Thr protein kinase)
MSTRQGKQRDGARLQIAVRPRARDMARMARLRIHLTAIPEEVPFARASITRLCEHLEIEDELAERIRLAVTEACTNCVEHAYGGGAEAATYVLDARVHQHSLRVVVCDSGVGVHNAEPNKHRSLGLGLGLIEKLADSSEVLSPPGGGTRIVMRFAMRSAA